MTVHTRRAGGTILGEHKRTGVQLAHRELKIRDEKRKENAIRKRRAELISKVSKK
jgi:hypothetical protein